MPNLLFLDSCGDHLGSSDTTLKPLSGVNISTSGRTGSCYDLSSAGAQVWLTKALRNPTSGATNNTLTVGCAYKVMTLAYPGVMIQMNNAWTNAKATLYHLEDGRMYFVATYGAYSVTSATSASVLTVGNWYYIEFSSTMAVGETAWVYTGTLKCNGETLVTATGALSGVPAESGWSYFGIGSGPFHGGNAYCDDVYVTDGEFLGDIRLYVIRPNAVGDENQWSITGSATAWGATKDTTPDYATTIIYTPTTGHSTTVNLEDLGAIGPIKGLQANYVTTKDQAGDASFSPRYKISGSMYDSSRVFYPSWQSWIDFTEAFRKNPITGNDWQVAEVNAMQQGLKRIS